MKVFLASLEVGSRAKRIHADVGQMLWNLTSYWYLRRAKSEWPIIRDYSREVLVDSGAHTFQRSATRTDFERYTHEYAEWIAKNDAPHILGYFEMDIDNVVGYDEVRRLREILLSATDKIIPVWHSNRGVQDYRQMVREFSGRWVSVTGFRNEDITDDQYWLFVKEAWDHNCRIHGLGLTRPEILDRVPFDSCDSSSWSMSVTYYRLRQLRSILKLNRDAVKGDWKTAFSLAYRSAMAFQRAYAARWYWLHQHKPTDRLRVIADRMKTQEAS